MTPGKFGLSCFFAALAFGALIKLAPPTPVSLIVGEAISDCLLAIALVCCCYSLLNLLGLVEEKFLDWQRRKTGTARN